jgi:hypothetical protein
MKILQPLKFSDNKNNFFWISVITISILRLVYSYFIPINIIPGAPHDDQLFYRLGLNISKGLWLGQYEPTTLIKGIGYPLFIAVSIFSHIPLRVLEGLLICISSIYFISSIDKFFNKKILFIGYLIIIFIPYSYGALDFRLLRDMIYPQFLLLVFSSVIFIYLKANETWSKINYLHSAIFGLTLFIFLNTREEGIWILPTLIIFLLFCGFNYKKKKKLSEFFRLLLVSIFIFIIMLSAHKTINYFTLKSPITNIFKDTNFQSGYSSILRISINKKTNDTISKNGWEQLFQISQTAGQLKAYVTGGSYQGWLDTGCDALKSQQKDMNLTSCYSSDPSIPVGHFMFALMDALSSSGLQNPQMISSFMKQLAFDIDSACEQGRLECSSKPNFMMPTQLFSIEIFNSRLLDIIFSAFKTMFYYDNSPPIESHSLNVDLKNTFGMQKKLRSYVFPLAEKKDLVEIKFVDISKFNISSGQFGYIDGVQSNYGYISIYGWALSSKGEKFKKIQIEINGEKICAVSPEISRPDISPKDPTHIGFQCVGNFTPLKDESYTITAYAVSENNKTIYPLLITTEVLIVMKNKFSEDCYLNSHQDVKNAVLAGKITAIEHFQEYGIGEKRKCIPIFSLTESILKYKDRFEKLVIPKNSLLVKIFNLNSIIYNYIMPYILYLILISLVILTIKKYIEISIILMIFISLFISRAMLLSLLDYVGLAVISPLYLLTGIYSYFIAGTLSMMIIFQFVLKKNENLSFQSNKKIDW